MPRTRSSTSSNDGTNLVPTNGDRANYGNALEILDSGYLQSAGPSNIEKKHKNLEIQKIIQKTALPH